MLSNLTFNLYYVKFKLIGLKLIILPTYGLRVCLCQNAPLCANGFLAPNRERVPTILSVITSASLDSTRRTLATTTSKNIVYQLICTSIYSNTIQIRSTDPQDLVHQALPLDRKQFFRISTQTFLVPIS